MKNDISLDMKIFPFRAILVLSEISTELNSPLIDAVIKCS